MPGNIWYILVRHDSRAISESILRRKKDKTNQLTRREMCACAAIGREIRTAYPTASSTVFAPNSRPVSHLIAHLSLDFLQFAISRDAFVRCRNLPKCFQRQQFTQSQIFKCASLCRSYSLKGEINVPSLSPECFSFLGKISCAKKSSRKLGARRSPFRPEEILSISLPCLVSYLAKKIPFGLCWMESKNSGLVWYLVGPHKIYWDYWISRSV